MIRRILFSLLSVGYTFATAVPDIIYTNHMVLQRNRPIIISGTADAAEPISVSFAGHRAVTTPQDGRWQVQLPAMQAMAEGQELRIAQGDELCVLSDVVVGEVWLAAGQSNMEFPLRQEAEGKAAIAAAGDAGLRLFYAASTVPTFPAPPRLATRGPS